MKRLLFYEDHKRLAVFELLGAQEDFNPEEYEKYEALEVVWQEDERFSVWGNLPDDADLLQDTKKDPHQLIQRILPCADEILDD